VKGATALLARDLGVRATIDVDVYREGASEAAEAHLRHAAAMNIGDWFRFEVGPPRPIGDGSVGIRLPASAYVGNTPWAQFHVALVGADVTMTGSPEDVPPLAQVTIPDVIQRGYRAYPLVDHIADKVAAIFQRYGDQARPSTRFKDLVDLVAIVRGASVAAGPQVTALASEATRRGIALPLRFAVPDRAIWVRGYGAEAARSLLPVAHTLDEAVAVVDAFLTPLFDGSATGSWDPQAGQWRT
jgi:hypothetical protein